MFASLLIAGLVFTFFLGRSVKEDFDALSTALHDDIRWNMSQLENEALKLDRAAHDAAQGFETDLSVFRKRFDIFYSRVNTLNQSAFYQVIRDDADAREGLDASSDFLAFTTPLVDGPDAGLRVALPQIETQTAALYPKIRTLALAGIRVSLTSMLAGAPTYPRRWSNWPRPYWS